MKREVRQLSERRKNKSRVTHGHSAKAAREENSIGEGV